MFSTFSRSWELTKQSWGVLRTDKTLIVFPFFSMIALLLVVASFAVPTGIYFAGLSEEARNHLNEGPQRMVIAAIAFCFYFTSYFVMTYFNVALVGAALERFAGRPATLGAGLAVANSRLVPILAWSALGATIGMILKALEERAGFIGRLVIRLIGVAWAIGTFFVVPVLAVEGGTPVSAIKRSVSILTKTWGEAALTRIGTGLFFGLLTFLVIIVGAGASVFAFANDQRALGVVAAAVTVLLVIGLSLIASTLQTILTAAIYRYAADGTAPPGFTAATLGAAFQPKKAKSEAQV